MKIVLRKLTTTRSVQLGLTKVIVRVLRTELSWIPVVRDRVANRRQFLNVTAMCVTVTHHALHGLNNIAPMSPTQHSCQILVHNLVAGLSTVLPFKIQIQILAHLRVRPGLLEDFVWTLLNMLGI